MCKLRDDTMNQAGELPMEKKMEDEGMFKPLKNLSAAEVALQRAAVRGEAVAQLVPKFAGQFDTHQQWVNKAQSWLASPDHRRAICVDSLGRRMAVGADMAMARDEGTFPVRFFWECELALVSPRAADAPSELRQALLDVRHAIQFSHDSVGGIDKMPVMMHHDGTVIEFIDGVLSGRAADALDSQPTELSIKFTELAAKAQKDLEEEMNPHFGRIYVGMREAFAVAAKLALDSRAPAAQAASVADGWKLVPIEPTDAMYFAACHAFHAWQYTTTEQPGFTHRDTYRAMLAAAPAPQQEGSEADNG